MASPDTDELATVPLPASAPDAETADVAVPASRAAQVGAADAETAPQERVEPAARTAASPEVVAETVPQERVEPELIEAEPGSPEPAAVDASPTKAGGRWWRGFTGSLAAGLAVLAVGVLAVAGACLYTGAPGPSAALLIGHPVAAVLALLAQRVADRRKGIAAAGAGVAVVLFTVSALTLFWLT